MHVALDARKLSSKCQCSLVLQVDKAEPQLRLMFRKLEGAYKGERLPDSVFYGVEQLPFLVDSFEKTFGLWILLLCGVTWIYWDCLVITLN